MTEDPVGAAAAAEAAAAAVAAAAAAAAADALEPLQPTWYAREKMHDTSPVFAFVIAAVPAVYVMPNGP
jgi:hypothetical protein